MFTRCYATKLDISSFDTSNVTEMMGMFNIYAGKLETLDLSNFDFSSIKNDGIKNIFGGMKCRFI